VALNLKLREATLWHSLLAAIWLIAAAGCSGNPTGRLTGMVSYRGMNVSEGQVQLDNRQQGIAAAGQIEADGTFAVENIRPGDYRIAILPPMVTENFGNDGPQVKVEKAVKNIPKRYRQFKTSNLEVTISAGNNRFDILLE